MIIIKKEIIQRISNEKDFILKTKSTIRQTAKVFKISKSTVHKDLHERLKEIDPKSFEKIQKIMQNHIDVRHIRGGESTRKKYLKVTQK